MRRGHVLEQLRITGYAAKGKGVARYKGKVVFVPYSVEGDTVDVCVIKKKKNWLEGKIVAWHNTSDQRIKPLCRYFGDCGGCKWQMIPYSKQLDIKQDEVLTHYQRIAGIQQPAMLPIVGCAETYYYRNKVDCSFSAATYHTKATDEQAKLASGALGFHAPSRFDKVIPIQECHLMDDTHNTIRNTIGNIADEMGISFYSTYTGQGLLRNLQLRCSIKKEWMAWIIFGEQGEEKTKLSFLHRIKSVLPQLHHICYAVNSKPNDSLHDIAPRLYHGKGYITEWLGDISFEVDAKSFFQTNTPQAYQLYQIVKEFVTPQAQDTLYDLYCGMGSIGIFLAGEAKKIIGIDSVEEAIQQAKKNSVRNNIQNTTWICADASLAFNNELVNYHGVPDCIIADPPRAGLHKKIIATILSMRCPKIVYVSCNTATQARDVALLSAHYHIEKMQAVDMFPQTHHIENVALLSWH